MCPILRYWIKYLVMKNVDKNRCFLACLKVLLVVTEFLVIFVFNLSPLCEQKQLPLVCFVEKDKK